MTESKTQALRTLSKRFIGFTLVGALGTVGHYAVLIALVELGGAEPVRASVAGFLVGALINYTLNRKLVFRSRRAHREALPRFFAVAGVGFVGNAVLMSLLTYRIGLRYLLAQIATTGILLLWHFGANALWTFRERHPASR